MGALVDEYKLPFSRYDKVIELGGGDKPVFRPNLDCRWLKEVDIVADLNHPLPLPNGEYDGLLCRYCVEHLSWRKLRGFLQECFRILKPGGIAVLITANLLEQAKVLLNTERWDDRHQSLIWGDQDYPENTHRAGFSPESITRMLREAGFYEVKIIPVQTEMGPTDMMVEARKSAAKVL